MEWERRKKLYVLPLEGPEAAVELAEESEAETAEEVAVGEVQEAEVAALEVGLVFAITATTTTKMTMATMMMRQQAVEWAPREAERVPVEPEAEQEEVVREGVGAAEPQTTKGRCEPRAIDLLTTASMSCHFERYLIPRRAGRRNRRERATMRLQNRCRLTYRHQRISSQGSTIPDMPEGTRRAMRLFRT